MGRVPKVAGRRQVAAFVLGFVGAAVWLPAAGPAAAQWRVETTIAPPPSLKPRVPPARPRAELPSEQNLEPAPVERLQRSPASSEERELEDREEADRETDTPVAATTDTDRTAAPEPREEQDGIIVVEEPTSARDGNPDPTRDARLAEDVAAFASPPAGYNPYLYQIEIEPLADRRTAELFRLEPYAARGIRIGSFVIFPEAEIGAISTNNIFRSPARHGDSAWETRGNVRIVSDWRTHAMELRGSGLASFYDNFPSEDDRAYALEARGRIDLTRRTNIEALALHQLDKDSRSNRDSPANAAERGDIETSRFAAAFNHRFNRLALQLRGSISDVEFAPVSSVGGGTINNDERSYTEREAAFRASWALSSRVSVFAETGVDQREFQAAPADGILRSSQGERYRVGATFSPLDPKLRGEVSVGWGQQRPDDARLGEIDGIIVDANLAWRATPLTTFLLTVRSDFNDTTAAGSGGVLARQVGVEARHAFRRHLTGIAGVRYTVSPYDGISLTERELLAELGVDYYLGRDIILFGRYQHIDFETSTPVSDYTADIVRVGMRVRQ